MRLLVRSAASLPEDLRAQVDCQTGDLLNRESLLRAMEGMECVVHLARANVKSWADYQKFEIEATRQVAECALEAGVKRFIYAGTIDSYYAGRRAGTITEATPLDRRIERRNLYARAKAASEEILLRMHRERGLPLVIVRPGIVIGRGGSPFHWGVGMWWHEAVCQIWGEGTNKLPLVLVEDVARALIAAMEKPGIEGRSFNLVADPCLSAQEYLDELDRAGGMRVERYATPIWRFYLQDMMKWVVKVAVRHPERRLPSYRDWESRTQRARFDCTAAKTVLGWNPVSERGELVRRGIEEPLREYHEIECSWKAIPGSNPVGNPDTGIVGVKVTGVPRDKKPVLHFSGSPNDGVRELEVLFPAQQERSLSHIGSDGSGAECQEEGAHLGLVSGSRPCHHFHPGNDADGAVAVAFQLDAGLGNTAQVVDEDVGIEQNLRAYHSLRNLSWYLRPSTRRFDQSPKASVLRAWRCGSRDFAMARRTNSAREMASFFVTPLRSFKSSSGMSTSARMEPSFDIQEVYHFVRAPAYYHGAGGLTRPPWVSFHARRSRLRSSVASRARARRAGVGLKRLRRKRSV